jgi:hypothetical protein
MRRIARIAAAALLTTGVLITTGADAQPAVGGSCANFECRGTTSCTLSPGFMCCAQPGTCTNVDCAVAIICP